jgi:hypothetical protein
VDLQKKMSWEDLSEKKSPGENLPQFKMAPIHRVKSQELVGDILLHLIHLMK